MPVIVSRGDRDLHHQRDDERCVRRSGGWQLSLAFDSVMFGLVVTVSDGGRPKPGVAQHEVAPVANQAW